MRVVRAAAACGSSVSLTSCEATAAGFILAWLLAEQGQGCIGLDAESSHEKAPALSMTAWARTAPGTAAGHFSLGLDRAAKVGPATVVNQPFRERKKRHQQVPGDDVDGHDISPAPDADVVDDGVQR